MLKTVTKCLFVISLAILSTAAADAEKLLMAKNGVTNYTISLASDSTPAEKTAASELAHYLKAATGADFRIVNSTNAPAKSVIAVGPRAARAILPSIDLSKKELGDDGIVIEMINGNIILTGASGSRRGTIYAVYQFLEDYVGIRWFTSTEEYVPDKPALKIDIKNRRYVPALPYRDILYQDMVGGSGTGIDPQSSRMTFAVKMKVNGHFSGITEDWGGQWNIVGWCHTAYSLMPPQKYFSSHPDWYSERDGKRVWDGAQLCYTNQGMLDELTKNVLEQIRQNPNAGIIDVSQNDWGGNCQCENCRKIDEAEGSACGSVLYGINKVAEAVEKQYPGYFVEFISYQYSRKPPKTMKPRSNVIVRLCVIERSCTQPIDSKINKSLYNDLKVWRNTAQNLMLWDYTDMLSNSLRIHPNTAVFGPDFKTYINNNVKGVFCEGDDWTKPIGDDELKHYVMAHQLWDPSLKTNKLIDDFIKGYYGPAAPMIRKYVYNQIKAVSNTRTSWNADMNTPRGVDASWITLENMNASTRLFDLAEQKAGNDSIILNRVKRMRLQLDHQWLAGYARYRKEAKAKNIEFLGPEDPYATLDRLVALSKSFGVDGLAWGYYMGIDEYASKLRNFIKLYSSTIESAPLPVPFNSLPAKDVLDIQEDRFDLFSVNEGHVSIVADAKASNGSAALLNPAFANWAAQCNNPEKLGIHGSYHAYAVVRIDKILDKGVAFVGGVYNWSKKASELDLSIQLDPNDAPSPVDSKLKSGPLKGTSIDMRDGEYHVIDLGVYDIGKDNLSFWFGTTGGVSPKAVKGIYIDRVFFVKSRK